MWAQARATNYSARPRSGRPLFGEALARGTVRRSGRRRVGFGACFHAIAQARVVGLTVPDRRALAYAARGVRRTASRCCVSSGAALVRSTPGSPEWRRSLRLDPASLCIGSQARLSAREPRTACRRVRMAGAHRESHRTRRLRRRRCPAVTADASHRLVGDASRVGRELDRQGAVVGSWTSLRFHPSTIVVALRRDEVSRRVQCDTVRLGTRPVRAACTRRSMSRSSMGRRADPSARPPRPDRRLRLATTLLWTFDDPGELVAAFVSAACRRERRALFVDLLASCVPAIFIDEGVHGG